MIHLPDFSTLAWIMAVVAALCIGLTKAGFNGFAIITILLMARIMPAKESTGAVLPMLIAADLMAIGIYRRHVSWKDFWGLLPTTFLGLLAGWLLMKCIPDHEFGKILGWMILLMMLLVVCVTAFVAVAVNVMDGRLTYTMFVTNTGAVTV